MSLNFFNPKRTQPFIITFFMAVMAFKRYCKLMRKRLLVLKKGTHSHQLSLFRRQVNRSNNDVYEASRGRDVIQTAFIQKQIQAESAPKPQEETKSTEVKTVRKISTNKLVRRHLDDYAVKLRLGRGAPATVDRLQKALILPDAKVAAAHHKESKPRLNRKSTMIMSAMKAAENIKPIDFSKSHDALHKQDIGHGHGHGHQTHNRHHGAQDKTQEEEEGGGTADDALGYEAGTSIYFGATIALQARHGGFLSYNSTEIKASAHKVLNNSRFIVKNSEDLTDVGVVKYGAALWLQAGHHEVLGAQYGTLVDQKRTIQPALVSCKRASMFKAQQYGRWIILNRNKPMETIGHPVLHDDKIMLEQEWYFLASASPYQSSMHKTLSNSDEAMTTKTELFNPGDECSWKVHLVALPMDDKAGELQRQLLLQQAKESIDESSAMRYEKAPSLLTSLASKLPDSLTDHALFSGELHRKSHAHENQHYLLGKYRELGAKQFHSNYNPIKFLSRVYGPNSNIVRYKAFVIERNESDLELPLSEGAQQVVYNPDKFESTEVVAVNPIEAAEEKYWQNAQKVLLDTKSWVELPTAMGWYYRSDRAKKIRAASVLQRWIRKFLNNTFDFERSMKKVDNTARNKLQEKLIARRKFIIDHVSSIEAIEHGEKIGSVKFGNGIASSGNVSPSTRMKSRGGGSISGPSGGAGGAVNHLTRTNTTGHRSASLNMEKYSGVTSGAALSLGLLQQPTPAASSESDRRRSRSMAPMSRSKSLAQINDISQIVGVAGMAAIFSAAGLPTPLLVGDSIPTGPLQKSRSQSMIFQHTEVRSSGLFGGPSGAGDGAAAVIPEEGEEKFAPDGMLASMHQSQSMSSLPGLSWGGGGGGGNAPGRGSKSGRLSIQQQEAAARIEARNQFATYLGFDIDDSPSPTSSSPTSPKSQVASAKNNNTAFSVSQRPSTAGAYGAPVGLGIAYEEEASQAESGNDTFSIPQYAAQRPYTADAALRAAPALHHGHHGVHRVEQSSSKLLQEQTEREAEWEKQRQKEEHEAHKAAKKAFLHAETKEEKRRLGRSATNEFGLPRDVFRETHGDISAKIGLKFLRAVSKNPSIYEDVQAKKRPSSSSSGARSGGGGHHRHRSGSHSHHSAGGHHRSSGGPPASSDW